MTNHEENIVLNLKYSPDARFEPLKLGNNQIYSSFLSESNNDKIILFNLILIGGDEAYLRTFDHSPLMIKFTKFDTTDIFYFDTREKEILIQKQTIIKFNSILNIRIFPLNSNNSNNFFYFESEKNLMKESPEANMERKFSISDKHIAENHQKVELNDIGEQIINQECNSGILHESICSNLKDVNDLQVNDNKDITIGIKEEDKTKEISVDDSIEKETLKMQVEMDSESNCKENYTNNIEINLVENETKRQDIAVKTMRNQNNIKINSFKPEMRKIKTKESPKVDGNVNQNKQTVKNSKTSKIIDDEDYDIQLPKVSNTFNDALELHKTDSGKDKISIIPNDVYNISFSQPLSALESESVVKTKNFKTRLTRSKSNMLNEVKDKNQQEMLERKRKRQKNKQIVKLSSSSDSNTNIVDISNKDNTNSNLCVNESVNKNNNISCQGIGKTSANKSLILNNNLNEISKINVKLPCPICLEPIKNSSSLDNCEHKFCKECIDQWATLSNECPLCKEEFKKIIYREAHKICEKKVRKRRFKFEEEEEEPWYQNCAEFCMVCNKNNDEHLLLVCDRCTYNICHTYCAGLDLIPDDEWLCSICQPNNRKKNRRDSTIKIDSNIKHENNTISLTSRKSKKEVNELSTNKNSKASDGKNEKNFNIPINYNLKDNENNKNQPLNFNVNVNLKITKSEQLYHNIKKGKRNKFKKDDSMSNNRKLVQKGYNLRKLNK